MSPANVTPSKPIAALTNTCHPDCVGDARDRGALRATSAFAWADVLARLTSALYREGFAVWADIDLSQMRAVRVLGSPTQRRLLIVGHPQLARQALATDEEAALHLAASLLLHRTDFGHVDIRCLDPRAGVGSASGQVAHTLATGLEERLRRVLAAV